MTPNFPYGKMVTLIRRTVSGVDEFGNDVFAETRTEIGPCSVQPSSAREVHEFNDQATTGITVYAPYGTDIRYTDAMIVDGVQYEIEGHTESWMSPFSGHVAPIRIYGIAVEGASN